MKALLTLFLTVSGLAQTPADPQAYLTYQQAGKDLQGEKDQPLLWDRNLPLKISVKQSQLVKDLALGKAYREAVSSEVKTLKAGSNAILKALPLRLAFENDLIRLSNLYNQAKAIKADSKALAALTDQVTEQRARKDESSKKATAAFSDFRTAMEAIRDSDPKKYAAVNAVLLSTPGLDAYTKIGDLLKGWANDLQNSIQALGQNANFNLLLKADWVGEDGRMRAIHVPGYDQIQTGLFTAFGHLTLAADPESQAELTAAANIKADILDNTKAFTQEIKTELETLRAQLTADLKGLKQALGDLAAAAQKSGVELESGGADALQAELTNLTSACPIDQTDPILVLQGLLGCCEALQKAPGTLAMNVKAILADVQTTVLALPGKTQAALSGPIKTAADQLKAAQDKLRADLMEPLAKLRSAIATGDTIWKGVDASSRSAKSILDAMGNPANLDTTVDLHSVVPPRPAAGDAITVTADLTTAKPDGTAPKMVASGSQMFEVRHNGLYWDTPQGMLMIVLPKTATYAQNGQSYVPALAVNLCYGVKGSGAWAKIWNEILAPGFGFSLATLRLDPTRNAELGLAANLSLFHRTLSVGYGRDLQVHANYAYLGLNPIAIYGLFNKSSAGGQ
jgi:hypothetical protein